MAAKKTMKKKTESNKVSDQDIIEENDDLDGMYDEGLEEEEDQEDSEDLDE